MSATTLQLGLHLPSGLSLLLLPNPNLTQRLLQDPLIRLSYSIPRQSILEHHQHWHTMLRKSTGDKVDNLLRGELADELGPDYYGSAACRLERQLGK